MPVNNSSVHMDVSELIVHIIMIGAIDEPSVGSDPPAAVPSVVIRPGTVPVPVAVQPRADGEARAERNRIIRIVVRVVTLQNSRVVLRNINNLRLCGFDPDVIPLDDDFLLRIAVENSGSLRLETQALNRPLHVLPLHNVGLSNSRDPVRVLGHHLKHIGIMGKRFDADIPGLRFNQAFVQAAPKHRLRL